MSAIGPSGHRILRSTCLLLTQSGHALLRGKCPQNVGFAPTPGFVRLWLRPQPVDVAKLVRSGANREIFRLLISWRVHCIGDRQILATGLGDEPRRGISSRALLDRHHLPA
jgi:hypothetical protein